MEAITSIPLFLYVTIWGPKLSPFSRQHKHWGQGWAETSDQYFHSDAFLILDMQSFGCYLVVENLER